MYRAFVLLVPLLIVAPAAAREIAVKWKKTGTGFLNENRLPPGATVKIKVHALCEDNGHPGLQLFSVNGRKLAAKTEGDQFRDSVDGNGNVAIGRLDPDASVGRNLRFGKHDHVRGIARWLLIIEVIVVD